MRINAISMTMETRVNYGDFQGAMACLKAEAELGDETLEEGCKKLRATLQQQLVYCIKSGSPNTMRTLLKGKDDAADEGEGETEEKPKRKRRTKAEIEADKKKAAAKKKKADEDELDEDEDEADDLDDDLDDDKPASKKGSKKPAKSDDLDEDEDDELGDDDDDELSDDEPEIDRQTVMKKLRELKSTKSAAMMQKAVKKVGAASFSEVPNDKLQELYNIANKLINS